MFDRQLEDSVNICRQRGREASPLLKYGSDLLEELVLRHAHVLFVRLVHLVPGLGYLRGHVV